MLSVSSSTLRQWENAGLTHPRRTKSGYRTYSLEELDRLKAIHHLRFESISNCWRAARQPWSPTSSAWPPGTSSGGSYQHEGEEVIFVISGSCDEWLDEVERYRIYSGDSLYFSSSQTHRWSNPYKQQAVLLWINTPPTF